MDAMTRKDKYTLALCHIYFNKFEWIHTRIEGIEKAYEIIVKNCKQLYTVQLFEHILIEWMYS
jgi:hypothetical protein